MEYPVNKGAGNPVEFKGLKSQYLFVFAGGLAMVLLMVVFLYLTGVDNGYAYPWNPVRQPVGVGYIPFECPLR